MEMAVSNRIYDLMTQRGLSKAEFARLIGKRPCEITKWLSGQHNFTLSTLAIRQDEKFIERLEELKDTYRELDKAA